MQNKTVILGSGISGISAGYHLKQKGEPAVIFERDADWGGLCGNFSIDGFRFDRFVHFTFADDENTQALFAKSVDLHHHTPFPYNYYNGTWLRHPAQNNLFPLSAEEKTDIIADFVKRPQKNVEDIADYAEWLRVQYGNYFAENFPFKYTRKYWGVEAEALETKWVGVRMTSPNVKEVLKGAFEDIDECMYYAKVMKYPKKGGFRSILDYCRQGLDIQFNKEVIKIADGKVYFADGTFEPYDRLISSLPLPEMVNIVENVPQNVQDAVKQLKWTSGYEVSLGFNKPDIAKHLWFYIYDEDIPPARVYSPNLKSPDNAPEGCSSLQAEIFFANDATIPSKEEVLEKTIAKLQEMHLFNAEDIVVQDIRFEKYANITFTPEIYENREIVRKFLLDRGIETIGRFGEWGYLWTHQAFQSGKGVA